MLCSTLMVCMHAGTLMELTHAWSAERPIAVFTCVSGTSAPYGNTRLDHRGPPSRGPIVGVTSIEDLAAFLQHLSSGSSA